MPTNLIEHIKALERKYSGLDPYLGKSLGRRTGQGCLGAAQSIRQKVMPAFKAANAAPPMLVA
jgi:hypothetical protein